LESSKTAHRDAAFRDGMLQSHLCLADGMPHMWIAKLLGMPIRERVATADLLGRLEARTELVKRGQSLVISGASPRPRQIFQLNRFEFLLGDG